MSINTYDEQKFWEEVDILFPDIVKAITSLAKKSYISITNLRNGVTWWSEKAMEYFGMQENYTIRGQEKSKRSIHPDDLEDFRRGFRERVAGKNMDEPWEYRVRDGSTYIRISARAKMLNDKDGKPFVIVIRYNNYSISDEVDATTGLHTEPALDREIMEFLEESGQGALLKIGLDQFSHINVMYGAAFSDKILNCAAQELLRLFKGKGYVYRLSGAKFVISFKKVSKAELQQIYDEIVETFENTEVEGKKIPLKVSAGAIFMEPYMKETNAVRSRLTYALNHSRLEHHGELVIFNDEVCGSDENQFELIGVIHQCATHNFEGFRMFYQPIPIRRPARSGEWKRCSAGNWSLTGWCLPVCSWSGWNRIPVFLIWGTGSFGQHLRMYRSFARRQKAFSSMLMWRRRSWSAESSAVLL